MRTRKGLRFKSSGFRYDSMMYRTIFIAQSPAFIGIGIPGLRGHEVLRLIPSALQFLQIVL